MTMPDERTRAVMAAYCLLFDLMDPKKTPRVPPAIRDRASRVLRHFPGPYYLSVSASHIPDVWGHPE